MKNKILELIDSKIEMADSYYQEPILQELRLEIEKMEEWISEDDRLPEKAGFYLTTFDSEGVMLWQDNPLPSTVIIQYIK